MEVNSLHSWKLKWTIVNEAASIQGYRPARSALLPASNAGITSYLTSSYNFRNLNYVKQMFFVNVIDVLASGSV